MGKSYYLDSADTLMTIRCGYDPLIPDRLVCSAGDSHRPRHVSGYCFSWPRENGMVLVTDSPATLAPCFQHRLSFDKLHNHSLRHGFPEATLPLSELDARCTFMRTRYPSTRTDPVQERPRSFPYHSAAGSRNIPSTIRACCRGEPAPSITT